MKPIRIWGWLGGHDDGQRPIGLWRSPWQPRHRPRLSIATGSSARDVTHFITSIIQSFVYKCNNSNSCKLFYLDYKSMLIHKLPQTPYTAFPLDWQVWAQENTVYSAFSKCISWWAMDLVGKPNITSLIWNHFHSCHPSAFVQVSSSSRDCKRLAGDSRKWKMPTRNVATYAANPIPQRACADEELTRPLARWRNSEPCLNWTPRRNTTGWVCLQHIWTLCQYVINRTRQFTVRDCHVVSRRI